MFYFMLGLSDKGQKPHTASSKRVGGRWGQRAGLSEAKEARGKATTSLNKKRQSGRWGVAQTCNCRLILDAIASLLEVQRPDLAMVLIEQELNSQT